MIFILFQFIKDDDIDDDEIRQHLHTTSEDDYDSLMFSEGGYYGDTECGSDDTQIQTRTTESGSVREIYPAIFRILIELIINFQKEEDISDILSQVLHKLLQTLRASHKATMAVCNEVKNVREQEKVDVSIMIRQKKS